MSDHHQIPPVRLDDPPALSDADGTELAEAVISMAAPAPPVATQFAGWAATLPSNAGGSASALPGTVPTAEDVSRDSS